MLFSNMVELEDNVKAYQLEKYCKPEYRNADWNQKYQKEKGGGGVMQLKLGSIVEAKKRLDDCLFKFHSTSRY